MQLPWMRIVTFGKRIQAPEFVVKFTYFLNVTAIGRPS
jgi:hypothetical protein